MKWVLVIGSLLFALAGYVLFGGLWQPVDGPAGGIGEAGDLAQAEPTLASAQVEPKTPDDEAERAEEAKAARTLFDLLSPLDAAARVEHMQARQRADPTAEIPFSEDLARLFLEMALGADWPSPTHAAAWLVRMGPRAAPFVNQALASDLTVAQKVRLLSIVRSWQQTGRPFALPGFLALLDGGSPGIKSMVLESVARGVPFDEALAQRLLELLREQPSQVKGRAGIALARMGPEGVALLIDLVRSGEFAERGAALRALAKADKEDLRPHLALLSERIRDAEEPAWIRNASILALRAMGGDCVESLPALRAALGDDTHDLITPCLAVLSQMGGRAAPAVPDLLRWLTRDPPRTADNTAKTLALIGARADLVLPALAEMIRTRASDEGAKAMGTFGAAALPHALRLLEEGDEFTKYAALWVFAGLGEEAAPVVPRLIAMIEGEDQDLAARAVGTLGYIGAAGSAAVPVIMNRLAKGESVLTPKAAAGTLARLGKPAEDALLAGLRSKDAAEQRRAIRVLSHFHLRSAFALDDLEQLVGVRDVRTRAAVYRAIGVSLFDDRRYGEVFPPADDPALVARVRRILEQGVRDKDTGVRASAREYLDQILFSLQSR